jgi:prophage regulatory protein
LEQSPTTIIRKREVERRTGLSYSQLFRLEQTGTFPERVQLSDRAVGWVEAEVDDWVRARIRAGGRCASPPLPHSRRQTAG